MTALICISRSRSADALACADHINKELCNDEISGLAEFASYDADSIDLYGLCIIPYSNETHYMNTHTGIVATYDDWWYDNDDDVCVNAVDLGEVVEVTWQQNSNQWVAA